MVSWCVESCFEGVVFDNVVYLVFADVAVVEECCCFCWCSVAYYFFPLLFKCGEIIGEYFFCFFYFFCEVSVGCYGVDAEIVFFFEEFFYVGCYVPFPFWSFDVDA